MLAHGPPPNHGQAFMVRQIVEGLKSDTEGILCVHVDFRLSDDLEDIGSFRPVKLFRLLRHLFAAALLRCRADVLFYVPAPPRRSAMLRDCAVGFFLRPLFRYCILNHRAGGLADFFSALDSGTIRGADRLLGLFTRKALRAPDLSIVLTPAGMAEAEALDAKACRVVPSGIADPCPQFEATTLLERLRRLVARSKPCLPATHTFRVLFLGNCLRDKGLFETISGFHLAKQMIGKSFPHIVLHLDIAGGFPDPTVKAAMDQALAVHPDSGITLHGFVSGAAKARLLESADALCLPTYYQAEGFPGVFIEAFAYGLPVITTDWRGINQLLPPGNPATIPVRSPDAVASQISACLSFSLFDGQRKFYLEKFTQARFISDMRDAIRSVREVR
ncbi:MAG: glycosyltransferase [Verrucomicrobiae bacterium]